ncbi:tail fiber assembly protein [Neisseriaceae bacterium CLB008]
MNEEIMIDEEIVVDEPEHVEPLFNHYFDDTKPHCPYTFTGEANPGTLPPNNAVRVAPVIVEGKWPCVKDGGWVQVPDKRGPQIWNTKSQEQKDNTEVIIPDGWTDKKPPTRLHRWTTKGWTITKVNQAKLDDEIAMQKKLAAVQYVATLRADCDRDILPLQDAVDLNEATPEEVGQLEILKPYRMELNRWKYPSAEPVLAQRYSVIE